MNKDELFIRRTIDLAYLGKGNTSPNPNVGAVITHKDKIIGEGFHQKYGDAHAEVNAVNNVKPDNLSLLSESNIYVSLEPCNIYGRTPPCSELILNKNIPNIIISCEDRTPGVDGMSITRLKNAGRKVQSNVLQKEGNTLAQIRNTFVTQERPYIIIKFAQSRDGYIGKNGEQVWFTNPISKRLVHKWRSESSAIMIGTNTALTDDPQLTNRLHYGKSPLRVVLDRTLKLPSTLAVFNKQAPTWIVTEQKSSNPDTNDSNQTISIPFDDNLLPNLLTKLWKDNHDTLIVEGGAYLINSFLKKGLWDEIRRFTGPASITTGIKAPVIDKIPDRELSIGSDQLHIFLKDNVTD